MYGSFHFQSYRLPTRSCEVAIFMLGLEREKAQAGEVPQSAGALTLEDMLLLHSSLFQSTASKAALHQAIVQWVSIVSFLFLA